VCDFSQTAARATGPEHHNEAPHGAFVARAVRGCTGCTLHVLCSPLLSYRRGIEGGASQLLFCNISYCLCRLRPNV
jgi:hypothetical protein